MADFSYYPLQKALYETLSGDTALTALVTGIFDHVPQEQDYPYVTFGDYTATDWSTNTTSGIEYLLTLHVWSREGGRRQATAICENIYRLLHDAAITVPLHKLVLIRMTSSTITVENDGATYHASMRFKAMLESQ